MASPTNRQSPAPRGSGDQGAPPQSSSSSRSRRNYQACLACKEQKVRCQLGSPDDPQPPCARCRRSRLDCVFGPPRSSTGRASTKRKRVGKGYSDREPHLVGPGDVPLVGVHAAAETAPGVDPSSAEQGGRPALGLFGQRVDAGDAAAGVPEQHTPWDTSIIENEIRRYDLSDWAHFSLCREGWITPNEAEFLVQCFLQWMEPLFPVIDETFRDPARRRALINEPVLCTAILTVASRYVWFEGSPSSSRVHEIHSMLFKQAQACIHQSLWVVESDASRENHILATIESIVLFVEWRPRPIDIMPNQGMVAGAANMFGVDPNEPPTAQNPIIDDETMKAYMLTRRLNTTSWRLLGLAVNLADEIDLVQGLSKSREAQQREPANVQRRARVRDLFIPLTWEISFRLGRTSFLKLPTPSATSAEEYAGDSMFAPLLNSRAELYRLCRLIENTLYSSVSSTKDIIASDRHPEMVASLAEIMGDWWNKFKQISGPFALRKTVEIQYHNVWMYLHAIMFQAVIERLRGCSMREPSVQQLERAYRPQGLSIVEILRSERSRRDLQMAEEIAKASVRVLDLSLDLDREGYLKFIPFTTMTWILTAAMLLLKGSGLRAVMDLGTTDLLQRISHSLGRAVVDDVHALAHYTSSLSFLLQKVQAGGGAAGGPHRNADNAASTASRPAPSTTTTTTANLPPMSGAVPDQASFAADPIFSDSLAEDWANWLSAGLDGSMDGSFGFDFLGAGDAFPPDLN